MVILVVASMLGVSLPVIHVNFGKTTQQNLKLLVVKHKQQVLRNHLVQAAQQLTQLFAALLIGHPSHLELDILHDVFAGQFDVCPPWFQLDGLRLAKYADVAGEVQAQHTNGIW